MSLLRALALLLPALQGQAQSWETSGELYAHFVDSSGDIGGVLDAGDTAGSGAAELPNQIDLVGVLTLRNQKPNEAIMFNAALTKFDSEVLDDSGTFFDAELTQEVLEISWSYRFNETYEVLLGARYQAVATDVVAFLPQGGMSTSLDVESWLDPIIGARAAWRLGEDWTLVGQFDVGGFGISSDSTWTALAAIEWTMVPHFGLVLGYRAFHIDYRDSTAADSFRLDALTVGLLLGIHFDFGPSS